MKKGKYILRIVFVDDQRARGVISCGHLQLCPGTRFEQCPGNRKRLLPSRFL
eukprot:COSAG06_NODE_21835_length_743_cov_6.503106_1_plen_51_part_10